MLTVSPPSKLSQGFLRIWEGFTDRFESLAQTASDHYILMPSLTVGIVVAAAIWNPVGWTLTFAGPALVGYKAYQASSEYFLGDPVRGTYQAGEAAADVALLGVGLALGKTAKVLTHAQKANSGWTAIHLVDEVAAGIIVAKKALQN